MVLSSLIRTFVARIILKFSFMTTVELRTSIMAELDKMNVDMLESVSHYVSRLRRHARPVRKATAEQNTTLAKPDTAVEKEEFTPRVMQFKRNNPWYASDEEVDRLRYEYLTKKY